MSKPREHSISSVLPTSSSQPSHSETDVSQPSPNPEGGWPSQNPLTSRPRRDCRIDSVRIAQRKEMSQNDVIIAVMGPTGAGKSTFIQTVTGRDNGVGHGLESCTSQVSAVRVTFSDHVSVVLVDTPGFDDTYLSDLEVLNIIAQWLKEVRQDKFGLAGILYLHRISDIRMAGTPLKNLAMFKKLCGEDFFKSVVLTTTMWPKDDDPECVEREEELRKDYWAEMIGRGSRTLRFENTKESAWNVLDEIIIPESKRRWDTLVQALRIQEELVDEKKKVPRTEAGQQLHGFIEESVVKQNKVLQMLKDELGKTADPKVIEALLGELGRLRRERENAIKDKRQLESSLLVKMRRVLSLILGLGALRGHNSKHSQAPVQETQEQLRTQNDEANASHVCPPATSAESLVQGTAHPSTESLVQGTAHPSTESLEQGTARPSAELGNRTL